MQPGCLYTISQLFERFPNFLDASGNLNKVFGRIKMSSKENEAKMRARRSVLTKNYPYVLSMHEKAGWRREDT
jgi:hypothetical protein